MTKKRIMTPGELPVEVEAINEYRILAWMEWLVRNTTRGLPNKTLRETLETAIKKHQGLID